MNPIDEFIINAECTLDINDHVRQNDLINVLISTYQQNAYHNIEHINHAFHVFGLIIGNAEKKGYTDKQVSAIRHALLFHDIHRDEDRSALIMKEMIDTYGQSSYYYKWHPFVVTTAASMIKSTRHHNAKVHRDLFAYVNDADLAILAEELDIYDEYAKKIRLEFSSYSDAEFNAGRTKVLKEMLVNTHVNATQPLFKTNYGKLFFQPRAVGNITRELLTLV